MSRLIRLLKSPKEKGLVREEELQMKCRKCGKRAAVDPGGLCSSCKFNDVLTRITEKK